MAFELLESAQERCRRSTGGTSRPVWAWRRRPASGAAAGRWS